ncbi:uncharacterized protein TNCT_270791 [Trichonephila clavata]|uniref:Uncharacterized protein n=1 Tax=Trichonephila clavata TaxID=2740835 RepID=A0A8X6KTR2_TRICU|nr:uncharacterized protein TNCT_270791 [Trichonephila clavata]
MVFGYTPRRQFYSLAKSGSPHYIAFLSECSIIYLSVHFCLTIRETNSIRKAEAEMEGATKLCIALFVFGYICESCDGLRCYTCSVDFRSEAFSINNTCIFPKDHDDLAHCSSNSKFCKAVITRVGGVFVMLQRSCATDCADACTEKGFGVRIRDCTSCCKKEPDCGTTQLMKKK